MAHLPLASGASLPAQQWRCSVGHTPPRLAASGSPGSSSSPMVVQTTGSTSLPSTVPFGVVPGSANMRRVVNTFGATSRGTSAPKAPAPCGTMLAKDPVERQQSRNSLKGGITPQGAASPNGGATPHGGTPRRTSRPNAQEPSCSPSRPSGVHVVTSAAWRVASPRQMSGSTVSTIPTSNGSPMAPRSTGERVVQMASSRHLESPQLSSARFDSPQASPTVSARNFPCRPALPTNGTRISGDPEVAEASRMRQHAPAVSNTGQHPMSYSRSSSSSHSHPVVTIHERACRSSQTPPPQPPPHLGIEVGGAMGHKDNAGVASSPAVSPQVPGSWALAASTRLNNSSCNSPLGASTPGSCPVLHLEEGMRTSEPTLLVTSAGAPPTPSPEDVPPWRSDGRPAKHELDWTENDNEDNVDCNSGLLNDIGWTPSFHSLAVASPGVASTSSPPMPVEPSQTQRHTPSAPTGPSAEEEARAIVMDIEAEAARAFSEKYSAAETAPKSVMRWDGKDWVPITPPSLEKTSGGLSQVEVDRALEELRVSYTAERRRLEVLQSHAEDHIADCERRIATLQGSLVEAQSQRDDFQRQLQEKSDKHSELMKKFRRQQDNLVEVQSQRDDFQRQLQEKSEKHSELVKKFRRHQEANKRLEEDLSQAAELRKQLETQAKQERLGKVAAEQMAKELQEKVQDFEKEVTAVAQVDVTEKVSADLEEQLEKLRRQLEETVRTVQLRCGPGSASGDLGKAAAVAAAATRGLTGSRHLSPSTLLLLDAASDEAKAPHLLGVGSWANSKQSTALSTEGELPTTEEQLLGEWSSTSLQFCESSHDRGSGEVARLADDDEDLDLPRSVIGLMGASSAESLGGASIGSVHSGVVLPLRQTSDDCSITAASEIFRLREPVASPIRSDDGLLTFEASPSVRPASQNQMSLRDLSEIKALKKPPPPIRMLMEVCCLLFHIQPLKQADERNAKKFKLDYWEPARRYLLSDPFFLSKLRMYKPDEISSTQRMKIKKYFQDPEFTAERLKTCSKAAYELYEWVSQLVQSEVVSNVPETRRNPLMAGSLRRRESPPCARTPQLSSAS